MVAEPSSIAAVMGGPQVLGRSVRSVQDLSEAVARGLPKDALRRTVRRVFPQPKEANEILYRIIAPATYKRRRGRLKAQESERTERLARIIASAEFVWNNAEKAHRWLVKPHPELRRVPPIERALTELGARQVEDLLDRIFYGLPV
jgi:putative toxin-antitoxin system antitoxin component (TIGR02293 family)